MAVRARCFIASVGGTLKLAKKGKVCMGEIARAES